MPLSGIKPVGAACFHEAATVFVCLGEEEFTDTLPFVSSIEGASHRRHRLSGVEASLRQPAVTPDFQLMIRETSNMNPGPPERKRRISPPFAFTVDDAEDSQRSCSGLI